MNQKLISSIFDYTVTSESNYLTHGIFRWYGKLLPQLVSDILDQYCYKGDKVVANFCGSGTIPLEASVKQMDSIGTDINPLALLISKVKTTNLPDFDIDEYTNKIIRNSQKLSVTEEDVEKLYEPRKWFNGDVPEKLISLRKAIQSIRDEAIRDFYLINFLSIVRECSNIDSRCVNHIVVKNKGTIPDVFEKFIRESKDNYKSVKELDKFENRGTVCLYRTSATDLKPVKDESIDFVFSHPPYLNAVNYFNIHRLCTDLMDMDYKEIREQDMSSVKVEKFLALIKESLKESYRVLKPGKRTALVIGDVRFEGNIVPLGVDTVNLMREVGFDIEDIFIWIVNRKAGMSVARRGNFIDHNFIIIGKKKEK